MSSWPPPNVPGGKTETLNQGPTDHPDHHNLLADVLNTVVARVLAIETTLGSVGVGPLTTEQIQDIVGAMIAPAAGATNVSVNYDDTAGKVFLTVTGTGGTTPTPTPVPPPADPGGGGGGSQGVGTPYNFTGADGASWDATVWTVTATGAGVAVVSGNRGLQRAAAATNSEVRSRIADLNVVDSSKVWKSYQVLLNMAVPDVSGGTTGRIVRVRADGSNNRYELNHAAAQGTYILQKFTGGGVTATTVASGTYTYTAGTVYQHRIRVVGDRLWARWWPIGTTEPSPWQVGDPSTGSDGLVMDAGLANRGFELVTYTGANGATATQAQRETTWDDLVFTWVDEPTPAAPNPTAGVFTTKDGVIVDPGGYWWTGVGWNMSTKIRSSIGGAVTDNYQNDYSAYKTWDEQIAFITSKGFNLIRVVTPARNAGTNSSLAQVWNGVATGVDALIAQGIVAMGPAVWNWTNSPNKDPSYATVAASSDIYLFDQWVARYKPGGTYQGVNRYEANAAGFTHPAGGSPFAWLDFPNEAWDYADLPGWVSMNNGLYNRAYTAGFRSIYMAEAPGWGNYIEPILDPGGGIFGQFAAGKTNVVIQYHGYDPKSNLPQMLAAFKANKIPIQTGELGTHYDESFQGNQVDGIDAAGARAARNALYANAWGDATHSSPGYVCWIALWSSYVLSPRSGGDGWLSNTANPLTVMGTQAEYLAGHRPTPRLMSGGTTSTPPPVTPPSGGTPTFRAVNGYNSGASYLQTHPVNLPASLSAGETLIIIAQCEVDPNGTAMDMSIAGWTRVNVDALATTTTHTAMFVKQSDGTEGTTATITQTNGKFTNLCAISIAITGGNALGVQVTKDVTEQNTYDTSVPSLPALTPSTTGGMTLRALACGATTVTDPAGVTRRRLEADGTAHELVVWTDNDNSTEAITTGMTLGGASWKIGYTIYVPKAQ